MTSRIIRAAVSREVLWLVTVVVYTFPQAIVEGGPQCGPSAYHAPNSLVPRVERLYTVICMGRRVACYRACRL